MDAAKCGVAAAFAQQLTAEPESVSRSRARVNAASGEFALVGAGDIAWCGNLLGAEATTKLIEAIPGTVFAAGDLVYNSGAFEEFQNCNQPTWGKFKDRTKPSPGNHEYNGSGASGYFQYWGKRAGDPATGYYSYDLGRWHILVLNTNCSVKALGGCAEGSPQEVWLWEDLAKHGDACIIAYGHHSLFSSGILPSHAIHPEVRAFWQDLYLAHADLVLAGHEHSYKRFAPRLPMGSLNEASGIRQIVVGTGGRSHTPAQPNSEVRNSKTFGVLKLTLLPEGYRWEFIPQPGMTFSDSSEGTCHNRRAPE